MDDPRLQKLKEWAQSDKPAFNKSDLGYTLGLLAVLTSSVITGGVVSYMKNKKELPITIEAIEKEILPQLSDKKANHKRSTRRLATESDLEIDGHASDEESM